MAVEEAVMVASAIGDASPLLGGKGGLGDISKEGRGGGRKRDSAVTLSLGGFLHRLTNDHCTMRNLVLQCAWPISKLPTIYNGDLNNSKDSGATLSLGGLLILHRSTNTRCTTMGTNYNTNGLN